MTTPYHNHGLTLSESQIRKLEKARNLKRGATLNIAKKNLYGNMQLPLTITQIRKIKNAKNGVELKLSKAQIAHMEKTGGFIPLLTLIPIIASALGAAGTVAGTVASAVNNSKRTAEEARHNREIEETLKGGRGIVSNAVGHIPIVGNILSNLLKKIGLGNCNVNGLHGIKVGQGIYLERQGSGPFLGRKGGR